MLSFFSIFAVFSAAALSYFLTPVSIRLCRTVGAMDKPDGVRKINTLPTPRLGGLAFFSSFLIFAFPLATKDDFAAAILSGGSILVAGGFLDDVFNVPPRVKILTQAAASAIALTFIVAPESFSFFGIFKLPLGTAIGFVFALFKMLFTTNAVNFSDGLDGLAAGLSVTSFISLFIFGFLNGSTYPAFCALLLAAAVIGFLPYNRYRAKTFMGDSGSQFLGFAIAILSLGCARENAYSLETTLFLVIPALDTTLSVIRRLANGKSPFSADKGHLHHALLEKGISHPRAVRLLVLLNAAVASVTLLFYYFS